MICKEFDPILIKSITFTFNCQNCGEKIQKKITDIPSPNFDAEKDTHRATQETDSFDIECPKCSKSYTVQIGASSAGGEIYCDDLPDDTEFIFEEESED